MRRAFVGFLLLPALLPWTSLAADELPTVASPAPAIRRADLERRLRVIASESLGGRGTGTAEARRAADYIADEMLRAGLEPAAKDGTFFQAYALGRPMLGADNALEVTTAAGSRSAALEADFQPFSMSPAADVRGGLAFVGYGITAKERALTTATGDEVRGWDDYAGVDVRGKIVLVLRKDPGWGDARHAAFRAKAENAAAHGAVGLLLCNDAATVGTGPDAMLAWSAPSGLPTASGPLPCAFVSRAFAASLLGLDVPGLAAAETALRALGTNSRLIEGVEVRLATDVKRSTELDARNVVGLLPGVDPARRDEVVIVGAHFDHLGAGAFGSLSGPGGQGRVHPGADDNGSGTVALLELAEHFASPENRPGRTLLFIAFSGEEMGLLGSSHYVRAPLRPLEKTVAMVNLDMVGRLRNEKLHVIGGGTADGLSAIVREANTGIGLDLGLNPQGAAGSDSLPFFRRRIPVLFFFTGIHDDYHRTSDTVDRIEFEGLERVTRLVCGVVDRLAELPSAPVFRDPPPRKRPPVLGIALGEGARQGVVLAAVTRGGAAEAAGLRAGDVVAAIADQQVRDARGLRAVVSGLRAGKPVRVVVLREGRRLVLEVVPRERGGGRRR